MWYFDSHLHHVKQTPGLPAAFTFIDHQPDVACKIASIEPDSRMYPLGVSTNRASDLVNREQNQLNHVLTQGSKLVESGDWDKQANLAQRRMRKNASCGAACNMHFRNWFWKELGANGYFHTRA